ncbi:MAG TPA: flagellar hook-length control protein FliK [Bryobacteraceae bacterium]|nr:flagellar hook-length control protein FliK [Bryobacteraceae bacterium]
MQMPLLPALGLNGLFHPFGAKISSRAGSDVSKLNPNQNNAAGTDSGQATDDFSQLLDASVGDSSGAGQASSVQIFAQPPVSDGDLLNQTKFDPLQMTWLIPSSTPQTVATDAPDTAVSFACDVTRSDSAKAKVRMLAGSMESALQSIPTVVTKDVAKPAPPTDTQKEDASSAPPSQSDLSTSVISIPLFVSVTPVLAKMVAPASDLPSITKPRTTSASSAPEVAVSLDNSKPLAGAETLAFQAYLSPEPATPAHTSETTAPPPHASAPAPASLNPMLAPGVQQSVSAPQTNGNASLFGNDSPAQGSGGSTAMGAPTAITAPASTAFNSTLRFEGKSSDDNHARQTSDSLARTDNIVSLPGQSAEIKAPDRSNSTQASSSTQAMPMQKQDGPASQAKTDITFRLQGQSGETVSVRVSDRAGDIQIAVRSTDPATAATLRHDLPTLQSGLERAGWRMESSAANMQPAAATHQPGRGDGGAPDQSRQGAQSRAEDYSQGGRRRSSPNERWMEMMNTKA